MNAAQLADLIERLETWARDCEDLDDPHSNLPGVYLPNIISGDFYDTLKTAADELRALGGGWLPIESVPNGTLVMLWMPDFEMYAAAAWKGRVTWCGRDLQPVYVNLQTPLTTEGKQLWIGMDKIYPTHWQPLPPSPSATVEG